MSADTLDPMGPHADVLPLHAPADGRRLAVPRALRQPEAPREPIYLRDHPVWPVPLFGDESKYGAKDAQGKLYADSELCLKIGVTDGTRIEQFSADEVFPPDMTLDAILRRWGSPTDDIGYDLQLFVRAEGGSRAPRFYLCGRRIYARNLPEDKRDQLGDEPWPVTPGDSTPRRVLEEIDAREREREESRPEPEPRGYGPQGGRYSESQGFSQAHPGNVWGGASPPAASPFPGVAAGGPAPPPFSADPGKKWTYWNNTWLQVPDPTADAPPPYTPAAGMVWAKINGGWQQIRDPSAPAAPSALDGLLKGFSTHPVETLTALGGVALALKQVLDTFKGPVPAPVAPAVDVDAKLAATRAEMQAKFEAERRARAEDDRKRAEDELRRAQLAANSRPGRDPAEDFAAFIERTKKHAKLLGLSEQAVDAAADGADSWQEFVLNLGDTEAGKILAARGGEALFGWLGRLPTTATEPIPGSRAALAAGSPPPEALPPGAEPPDDPDSPPGQ